MSFPRARLTALTAMLAVLALCFAVPAAADVACTGSMGADTIDDNLLVPDGASCTLTGTVVQGNVLVGRGASLAMTDATVDGNVQDDNGGAADVTVTSARIGGNIQLEAGTSVSVADTAIDGDLQLAANLGALRIERNTVGGNLQANTNTGGLTVVENTIDGNLQCQSNSPAPIGGGNVVSGSAEGQCAALTGDAPPSTPDPVPTMREIDRLSGDDRFSTAVRIAQAAFPDGAPVAYLARADQFVDALAGGSLRDGPILLVPSCGEVPAVVLDEVRRLDPQRIVALGGSAAVCDAVLTQAAGS